MKEQRKVTAQIAFHLNDLLIAGGVFLMIYQGGVAGWGAGGEGNRIG